MEGESQETSANLVQREDGEMEEGEEESNEVKQSSNAENSEDEGEDLMSGSRKQGRIVKSPLIDRTFLIPMKKTRYASRSRQDEEMTEADRKFIADEDEDEPQLTNDQRREKRKERKRKRKEAADDDLSEDELDLINENTGRETKKRLRKKADGERDEVAALFDEDEDDLGETTRDDRGIRESGAADEQYDSDDLDDFIIRDDSDGEEVDEEIRREKMMRKKERQEFAKNLGANHGISDSAWRDIEDLFGAGDDYPHAMYARNMQQGKIYGVEDDLENDVDVPTRKAKELTLRDVYEPSEIAEKMLTEQDENIRTLDIPERLQRKETYKPDDAEISREATILASHLMKERTDTTDKSLSTAIICVLRFLRRENFEVPFIWAHRRDFFDGILSLADLWKIVDFDERFVMVEFKKRTLFELIVEISSVDKSMELDQQVAYLADKIVSLDDVADTFAYIHLLYTVQVEQLNANRGSKRGRMAPWKSLYYEACKNNISEFKESVIGHQDLHSPGERSERPLEAAQRYICPRFPTAESVLEAARHLIAHEIAVNPQLRAGIRKIYFVNGVVTVTPTEKGIKEIQYGHPYYAFKYVTGKPVMKFVNGQFLQIMKAETDGLVTVKIFIEDEEAFVKHLINSICNDYEMESAVKWNEERKLIAHAAKNILFPQTVKWLKDLLFSSASDWVANRCQMMLESKISVAPFHIPNNDEDSPVVMAISWGDGVRNASTFVVILNGNGEVVDFRKLDKLIERDHHLEDVELLSTLISLHNPDVIAIGGFRPNSKTGLYKIMMEEVIPKLQSSSPPPVYIVEDEAARIFMTSKSAEREFPPKDYPILIPYCVSLARTVQDSTCEYAGLFNKDEDIKNLRLDPLQKLLSDEILLKAIERGFVNVVNHIGVDINAAAAYTHRSHTLPFVSGLGPRKAQAMISKILRSGGRLASRPDLIQKDICAAHVFVNCASFIRIRAIHFRAQYQDSALDVLDDTRVHPADYDLARKMAADALDLDDAVLEDDESPSLHVQELMNGDLDRLNLLLLDDYAVELEKRTRVPKKLCLNDIKKELMDPYKDVRRTFDGATAEEAFTMLTGESDETLFEGALINTIVSRVKDRFLNVMLPSGVEGLVHINFIDLPDGSEDLTRFFTINQALNTCVLKVNYERLSVDMSCRRSDIDNANTTTRVDEYFDHTKENGENNTKSKFKIKSKVKQDDNPTRSVQHPFWQSLNSRNAEEFLRARPRGDCVFRPSSKGQNSISITWKVAENIYKHIDVLEQDKPNEWTLGKTLIIDSVSYGEIDQIVASYIEPMTRRVTKMMEHPKFQNKSLIEMNRFLEEQVKVLKKSVYGFVIDPRKAGFFMLVYKHPANNPRSEEVVVTNKGYIFRKKEIPSVDQLLDYFKLSEAKKGKPSRPSSRPPSSSRPDGRVSSSSRPDSRAPSSARPESRAPPSARPDSRTQPPFQSAAQPRRSASSFFK